MRFVQKLLLTVILLLVLAVGLDCLLSNFANMGIHPILGRLVGPYPWPWAGLTGALEQRLFGMALTLMPLAYLAASFALWQRRPQAFRVQTSSGDVLLLEPGALIKFARLQVENHPAVVAQRVRVRQSGSRGVSVVARVSVRPIQSLPAIRHSIEQAIRDGFSQVMGIEKIDEVRIIIGLDDKSLNQRPGVATAPEAKPEPPIRAQLRSEDVEEHFDPEPQPDISRDETIKLATTQRTDDITERVV